ncbi:MAG: DUF11 domain-containing protein, partial [Saprospiraceae bacterium]|nr:DUF11 domain-containing protein [Saprospiraceae bacterium]
MTPVYKCLPALLLAFQTCLLSAQSISWQPLDGPLGSYQINDMARDGSGNLFMYMNLRIYLSTDQGDNWVERNTGITADQLTSFVRFLEAPNGTLYVHLGDILDGYLYRYDTGLQRWVNLPLPFGNYGPDGLDFDLQGRLWASTNESHSILYVSLNGGQSFEKVTPSISVDGWFDILATHNDEHNLIAVSYGASQKVFHFTRSGVTKQVISGRPVYYLGYNPHTGTAFYSDSDGSKRSANGGLNWQNLLVIPGGSSYQSRITKMFFDPGGRIWAQVGSALYFSDDDGLTWSPEPQMAGLSATFYRTGPATWFAANSCSEPGFSRTTDQGGSWTDLSKKFKQPAVQTILKNGAGDLYAKTCRRGGFERSADEGKTWTDLTIPDGAEMVLAVNVATRPDGLVLAVGANSKLYRSFDNGGSWKILDAIDDQPVAPPARFINFAIDPKGVCYFFNYYYGTWRSYDSGNTWQKINFASAPLTNDVSFHPNGDLYATDGFQAWRYHADGDSVSYLEVPGSQFFDFYSVHCTSTGTVFFTGYDLTQSQVYRIPSGGTVPEVLQTFPQGILPYRFLSNAEGDVFGFTGTGLYVSENNGDSWQNAGPLPAASWSTAYVSPDQYLYTGYNGTVIHRSATPTAESNRVTGRVWLDADGDCSFSAGETALPEVLVQAKGAAGDYRGFSGFDGGYLLTAPSGNFKLQVRPPNALFEPCFDAVPVQLDGPNDTAQADLPLRPAVQCPYLSVDLSAALLRRCFETTYFVSYRNQGTAPAPNAKVTVTLDPLFEFLSASLPVAAQSGLDYTFQLGTLAPGQRGTLALRLRISCDAALGETHCIIARIFPNDLC